jgi:hypothetical protein
MLSMYLCNSSVGTVVMLVLSVVMIISNLCCGHDEWCVMIKSVWCVFSKLLGPSWIGKYIVKTGCIPTIGEADGHHHRYSSDAVGVNSVLLLEHLVTRHRHQDHHGRIVLQHDSDHALWPNGSYAEVTVMFPSTQVGHAPIRRNKDLIMDGL